MKLPKATQSATAALTTERVQARVDEIIQEMEKLVSQHNNLAQQRNSINEQLAQLERELISRQGSVVELRAFLPQEEKKVTDESAV